MNEERRRITERVAELTQLRHEAESLLLDTGCIESINEMDVNSFLWISLLCQKFPALSYQKEMQDASADPYLRLAGLLEFLRENLIPKELQMQGLTIQTQDNRCHYCISGSISLDDLYKLCEHYQEDLHCTSKK